MVILFFLSFFIQTLSSNELQKVSLQLHWKHQFEFAGFYMAKEKGFYKDAKLDVELKEFDFGINIVDDVTSKKTTFGVNYPSLILDKSKGQEVVLLSAILQASPHALVTLESSGINSFKDFKDKTLMINENAISAAPFVSMLQSNKVSFDEIKKVPHTFNIHDLIDKKVDISAIFISNELYELDKKNIKYKIWDPKDYGFDFYDGLLFTSEDIAQTDAKMVAKFRDASLKGWQYAFSNIEETVEIILKKYNTQNKSKGALIYEAKELKKLAYYNNKELGSIEDHTIQRIFDVYNLLGLTQNIIDIDRFVFKSNNDFKALEFTQEEIEFIKTHPIIKVGGETDWPPFDYVQNGEYTGIAKDYLDLLEKYTGLKFDVKTGYTWDELLSMAKNKELDVMPMIFYTKEREKYFNYTNEYLTVRNYLFSSQENPDEYNSLEDLNGKTIAIPKGFAQIAIIKKEYPQIKILETKNVLDSIDKVITKKADTLMGNIALVNYIIKSNNINGIKSNFPVNIGVNSIYMTSRKDWPILRNILQKGLDKITALEKFEINEKWMKTDDDKGSLKIDDNQRAYLKSNRFNVFLNNWLPISIFDEQLNEFSGLSIDYWNKINELIPIEHKLVYTGGFLNSINRLKKDDNGVMISLSYTDDRANYGAFSKPYVSYPVGVVTQDKEQFILDLNELEGKKIAVGKNYSAHKLLLKHHPKIEFVPVKNTIEALELVAQGKVYGAADILLTLKYYLQKYAYTNLKVAGTSDFKFDIRIMVNKEHKELIPIINRAIDSIKEDDRRLIQNKWIQTIQKVEKIDYSLAFSILVFFIFIVVFLLWRHKELTKYKDALEEKTAQLHDYIEASTDYIWEVDEKGVYTNVSDRVEDILGYTPKEMIGKTLFDFMPEDEALKVRQCFSGFMQDREPIEDLQNINIHKDGSKVLLITNGLPVFKHDKFIGYRGTGKDITEEKEKDLIILEQAKMAFMGEMIGNIAHQWRQPLSMISSAATGVILQKDMGVFNDNDIKKTCQLINENAQYLSKTIDTFRNFINEEKIQKAHPVEIEILQAVNIMKSVLENNYITLHDSIDYSQKTIVNIVVNELSEVVINILNNAKDIIIEKNITDGWVKLDLIKASDKLIITIEDNGGGIPEEILPRIFEPYFTTKHQAQGTGLGLHMSYKIITESYKGKLYANNTNKGAKFIIELPL